MSKDKTILGATEDAHVQNKFRQGAKNNECSPKPENISTVGSQKMVIPIDGGSRDHPHELTGILKGKNLSRCKKKVKFSDQPECSLDDNKGSNLPNIGPSNYRARLNSRQNQWQHLYQLSNGSHVDTSYKNINIGQAVGLENGVCTSFPDSLAQRANRNERGKEVEGKGGDTLGRIQTKILSKSGFSEVFEKSTLEGKGVFRRVFTLRDFNLAQRNSMIARNIALASNSSLQHEVKAGMSSMDKNSEIKHQSSDLDHGINLREWLKVPHNKANKMKCLHIFKCIVELVNHSHAQGVFLRDLRPSSFEILTTNQVKYIGSFIQEKAPESVMVKDGQCSDSRLTGKRPLEQGNFLPFGVSSKKQKNVLNTSLMAQHSHNLETEISDQLEENWYASPEELNAGCCSAKSNIFSLGVLLFELLGKFESDATLAASMSNLREMNLPPNFLSDNLNEVEFCLWLLHPEPASRPTTREILESELINSLPAELPASIDEEDAEIELLLEFFTSINEQKQKQASNLVENIRYLESDIEEVKKRHSSAEPLDKSGLFNTLDQIDALVFHRGYLNSNVHSQKSKISHIDEERISKNISQLGSTYFSLRPKVVPSQIDSPIRNDIDVLTARENCYLQQKDDEKTDVDRLGAFFDGFCKYSRHRKFEVCGVLRNGDFNNSSNGICSMSFDRDKDYFAAAGVSKKIRIFYVNSFLIDSVDIHYPAVEMFNESSLSCVCWNSYIRNYLASADYDGVVKVWDATVGQEVSQFKEHVRKAWSVDFSQVHPTKLASGSDDCTVKLWSINEGWYLSVIVSNSSRTDRSVFIILLQKKCLSTIWNTKNVCCVQFSAHSTHLLAIGSSDYKTYCFDLRYTKSPWCVLDGHEKAVSFVKFLDSETLVSASTDNTLKLWDLNRTTLTGLSANACTLTFSGHTNEKNFVGLSVSNGYIACGSETNEVYAYHRSQPVPVISYKFGSIDPVTGKETEDDNEEFVSSVCWRGKSDMVVAANSSGCIKVLQMV